MIPILFESSETTFTSNGIGRLSDAILCEVTEERNGKYELEMQYPVSGAHYDDIIMGRFIFAKPAKYSDKQPFEIYDISKPLNGKVSVYARHISYRLSMTPAMPFTATSCANALSGLKSNAVENCPFTLTTDKSTIGNYVLDVPKSIRSQLGGVEGSILDVYGGEYEWDMYTVKLWAARGANRGVTIRYGKNLVDLTQEESIADTITGIVPYYSSQDTLVTLPEKVIESTYASSFPYHRTIAVDLTSEFNNVTPTESELRNAGNAYISSHDIGVPKVSLTVSFANLSDTEEYKDIAVLEEVRLCDTVTVLFEKLGVNSTAKVTKTVYNVLTGHYTSIGLGESKTNIASEIATQSKTQEEIPDTMQAAIRRATDLITGESGGYVIIHNNAEGKPYEILVMDTEDINTAVHVWRWNQSGWGYSSTGYNGTYALAATIDGGIVADFITAGTITGIAYNNGNGTFKVDSSGNLTATSATIKGSISGSTITGSTISGNTISGGTITGGAISGGTISGTAITGGTISGGAISGETISGSAISGGTISGTTITGSTLATSNGINITNSAIEFTQDVNALRYQISSSSYTTIAQTAYDSVYNLVTKLCDGVITHYAIPVYGSQRCMIFESAESGFYFRFNNDVIFKEIRATNINASANITAASGTVTGANIHSTGPVRVNYSSSTYGTIGYDANAGNFNFSNETSWANVAASNFITASSRVVKENIEDISEEDAKKILEIRPVDFDYKQSGTHSHGMIAEEVYEIYPDLVTMPEGWNEEDYTEDMMSVPSLDYSKFVPYLIKMVQMQQREIDELKTRLEQLNG